MYSHKPYLLLVDDDEIITLKILTKILKDDYTIKTATNGNDALSIIENGDLPDLIILDIELPDFDGFQICETLKNNHRTSNIPIILITGNTMPDFEVRGLEKGAIDYISKPFSPYVVKNRVKKHLSTLQNKDYLNLFMNE